MIIRTGKDIAKEIDLLAAKALDEKKAKELGPILAQLAQWGAKA